MKSPTGSADTFQSRDCKSPYIHHKNTQDREFGNFQETYNWIECESIHHPGKTYFFNLRTQCSTWIRPVPKYVQLQYFKNKSRIYNDNFTSDLDNPLITISDCEDKSNNSNEDEHIHEEQEKKVNFWHPKFLARSNYDTNTASFNNNDEKYSSDNFSYISRSFCEKDNYTILYDLLYKQIVEDFAAENNFEKCMFETKLLDTEKEEQSLNKDDVSIHPVLYLKNITPDCLIRVNVQRKKMKQSIKKQTQSKKLKLKTKKVIYRMYDSTAVNYEAKPEFPVGVKVTNLSDTSTTSTSCHTNNVKSAVLSNFEIPNVNSCLNLSNESSSNCSCSCTTSDSTEPTETG